MLTQLATTQVRTACNISLTHHSHQDLKPALFAPVILFIASLLALNSLTVVAADKVDMIPVTVEAVKETAFDDTVKEVGKINAIDSAVLNFSASEKISAIHFNHGDKVKKGQIIAELDNVKAKADLDKAKSTLALAKTKLERIEDLLIKEPFALAKQDVDELRENVNLADADFRQKQAVMNDYLIKAPFDGQLTSFSQSIGSQIGAATALVTLYSLHPVEVRYAISQHDFGKAKKGQEVDVTVEAYGDKIFTGVVNYVAPAVDINSGRVDIHATLENPEFKLAPGMFANIKQYYSRGIKRLLVPQNSIIANNAERFVWLVRGDSAVKQVVKLAQNTNDGYAVVIEGLAVGDLVVKTGMQNIKSDSQIKVVQDKNFKDSQPASKAESASKPKDEPIPASKADSKAGSHSKSTAEANANSVTEEAE